MSDCCSDLGDEDWSLLRRPETRQLFYERATKILVSKGGEHWCCRYPDLVRELLWLWQYDTQPTVLWLQSKLEDQLGQGCFPCVLEMNSSREEAVQGLDSEKFRQPLEFWEAGRLQRKFERLLLEIQSNQLMSRADWHESSTPRSQPVSFAFLISTTLSRYPPDAGYPAYTTSVGTRTSACVAGLEERSPYKFPTRFDRQLTDGRWLSFCFRLPRWGWLRSWLGSMSSRFSCTSAMRP